MTNVPAGIDDIEEAKSVVESEELADDRYGVTTTNSDTTSPNLVTATGSPNLFNTCDGVSVVESIPAAEVKDVVRNDEGDNADTDAENNDKNAVKQIQMTVAADAPWKDRLWEGSFTLTFSFAVDASFNVTLLFVTHFSCGISNYYATSKGEMWSFAYNSSTAVFYWNIDGTSVAR